MGIRSLLFPMGAGIFRCPHSASLPLCPLQGLPSFLSNPESTEGVGVRGLLKA